MIRQDIVKILSEGIHTITFTKVDGTERVMPCTLDPALLPVIEEKEEKQVPRKLNMDTIRVFATDIQEWRSFKVNSLTKIEGV